MWEIEPAAVRWRDEKIRPRLNQLTQKAAQRDATEYEVAVDCFNHTPFGHRFKHQFLITLWKLMWPRFFLIDSQGLQNTWCIRMAKAFCEHQMISLIGCASSSKSQCAAFYAYTLWKCNPKRTTSLLSTTSAEAGEARMWGYIKDLYDKDQFKIGKRIDSLQIICLDEEVKDEEGSKQRDLKDAIKFVKLKTGREGLNAVGTMCGRKNDFFLWVCDEENFMDIGILDARVNGFSNMGRGGLVQFIGIGNAPSEGSPLYVDAEPTGDLFPDGYRSVDIDVHEEWPTKTGVCLYFNGNKSPNNACENPAKPAFPFLMNALSKEAIRKAAMGEDTNVYWTQFYGFPPSVDVPDKVLTHKFLESNNAFEKAEWAGTPTKWVAGLDCGFRADGDPTVIDFGRVGKDVNGNTIISWDGRDGKAMLPDQKSKLAFEDQMAMKVLDALNEKMENGVNRDCHDLAIDIMGEGGMTLNAIRLEAARRGYKLNILPISSMGTADDRVVVPGERRLASEMFDRKVSQIWMMMRIAVGKGLVRGMSATTKAVQQLCARKFNTDEKKRFAVEQKKDMKKRLKRSPDFADARVYTLFLAFSHGVALGKVDRPPIVFNRPENEPTGPLKQYAAHDTKRRYTGWT